jgi:multidrug efflux system membrane fusion protein
MQCFRILCASLLMLFSTIPVLTPAAAQTAGPAVPVSVAKVQRADVPVFVTGLGTVLPFNSVTITARVDGQITKIGFSEGQEVQEGDVIVELDAAPLEAALAQAQAGQSKDEALLNNARLDLDRAQRLIGNGSGTAQQLDTAKALVAQLQASVKADQAAVAAAQTQLNYTHIVAPFTGRVGLRLIDVGNIVHSGGSSGIVTINQVRPISVAFDLRADVLQNMRASMAKGPVQAQALDRNDNEIASGKVSVVDNQVNVATGTVRFKAEFANTDESLWPGQFVTVRVLLDELHDVLTVPVSAVQRGPDGAYAFIVDSANKAQKRALDVGFTNKQLAVIRSGLQQGEQVITEGQYRVVAGSPVTVPTPSESKSSAMAVRP